MSSQALTRSRVSTEQLDALLQFMEEHPEFASGKQSVYSRFSSSKVWRLLAERLNAVATDCGGAHKSPDKWCRYWADIKYKARKKRAALGGLGELTHHEERLCTLQRAGIDIAGSGRGGGGAGSGGGGGVGAGRVSHSDDERKPSLLEDDMCSEGSGSVAGGGVDAGVGGGGGRVATEELLAEAAMRSALAAEKQAEAVTQAVELLRELVDILRPPPPPTAPPAPPHPGPVPPSHHPASVATVLHSHPPLPHHHRM